MARVVLTSSYAKLFAQGRTEHEVPGRTVRHLIRALDERYPGLGAHLSEGVAVAIDGVIHQNALFEDVPPNAEVCFIPAIEGG